MKNMKYIATGIGSLIGLCLSLLIVSLIISGINYLKNPTGSIDCGMCLEIMCDSHYGEGNWTLVVERGGAGIFHLFENTCTCKGGNESE